MPVSVPGKSYAAQIEAANTQTAVQRTPSIPTSLSAVRKMVEEKPLLKKQSAAEEKPTETIDNDRALDNQDRKLPEKEDVREVLDRIIGDFKQKTRHMELSVIRQSFRLQDEKVVFILNGDIQKDIFLRIRPELTGLLRNGLQNKRLEVTFEISENDNDGAPKLYTSTDKLRYLSDKSPMLKELQQRFGLETDF